MFPVHAKAHVWARQKGTAEPQNHLHVHVHWVRYTRSKAAKGPTYVHQTPGTCILVGSPQEYTVFQGVSLGLGWGMAYGAHQRKNPYWRLAVLTRLKNASRGELWCGYMPKGIEKHMYKHRYNKTHTAMYIENRFLCTSEFAVIKASFSCKAAQALVGYTAYQVYGAYRSSTWCLWSHKQLLRIQCSC